MRTLKDLQSEYAQILDTVRTSMLDMESLSELMYKLGEIHLSILTIQLMTKEAESLLREAQELALTHSSSQERH